MTDHQQNLYLYCGSDEFTVSRSVKQKINELCPPEEQSLGMETVSGDVTNSDDALAALHSCREAVQTVGFFGGGKTVWLKDAVFLSAGFNRSGELKRALRAFAVFLSAGFPEGHVLVISAPKADKRSAVYKACQKVGQLELFEVPEKDYQARPVALEQARRLLQERGFKAAPETLERLVEKTGFDPRSIDSEVEKLTVYLGGQGGTVSDADVDAIVSNARDSVAWDLVDAVAEKRTGDALRILRQLVFQGESAVPLFMALENRFRELLLYRDCLDRGLLSLSGGGRQIHLNWSGHPKVDAALSGLPADPRKTHPFRAGLLAGQARRFSAAALESGLEQLKGAHLRSVSTGQIKGELLLELFILRFGGAGARGTTRMN